MSFLAPLLLAGLVALAIPVAIHLVQRQQAQVVPFPSLMFLRKMPFPLSKRRRIRHPWLLALRCLALALLVLAFARPFFGSAAAAGGVISGARDVVVLLDRSYSMGHGDRWARAREAAAEVIAGLGPADRVTLAPFDRSVEVVVRASVDLDQVRARLDALAPGAEITRYAPAVRLAATLLEQSELPRREAVLISDFQKNGWDGTQTAGFPAGATLRAVSVADGREPANASVSAVAFDREEFSGRERVTVTASLGRRAGDAPESRQIALDIDGREVERRAVELPDAGVVSVTFAPVTISGDLVRGSVRLDPDALPLDDMRHFVLVPGDALGVLVIDAPRAGRQPSLFVTRALAIGTSPAFRVTVKRPDAVVPDDLRGHDVVVLNEVDVDDEGMGSLLDEFVRAGGGLLRVLGEPPLGRGTADAGTAPVDREGAGGALGFVDFSHQVFEIFAAPRSGDVSAARFYRYRRYAADDTERVLARFDDGSVALAERVVDRGRVLTWTSTLDTFWSDLPLKPVFLPLVHQLCRYLAGYEPMPPWHTVGDAVDLATAVPGSESGSRDVDRQVRGVIVAPSGTQRDLDGPAGGAIVDLGEPGFYELREGGATVWPVAVNVDLAESVLAPADPEEVVRSVTVQEAPAPGSTTSVLGLDVLERRQGLWRWLLLAGLALLALEPLVLRRLPAVRGAS